jgi:DNA-binding HxlR family transcriptional regulator
LISFTFDANVLIVILPYKYAPESNQHNMEYTPDVYNKDCPSQKVLSRVADRWAALIICALHDHQVLRNGELMRKIGGINQKMLTQTLRNLENDGLIFRTIYPTKPLKVEYSLTKLGNGIYEPLDRICRWTEENLGELKTIWASQEAVK